MEAHSFTVARANSAGPEYLYTDVMWNDVILRRDTISGSNDGITYTYVNTLTHSSKGYHASAYDRQVLLQGYSLLPDPGLCMKNAGAADNILKSQRYTRIKFTFMRQKVLVIIETALILLGILFVISTRIFSEMHLNDESRITCDLMSTAAYQPTYTGDNLRINSSGLTGRMSTTSLPSQDSSQKKQSSTLHNTLGISSSADVLQSCNSDQLLPIVTTCNSALIAHHSLSCYQCYMDNCAEICMCDELCDTNFYQSARVCMSKSHVKHGFTHLHSSCVIPKMTQKSHAWIYIIFVWIYLCMLTIRSYINFRAQFESLKISIVSFSPGLYSHGDIMLY